MKKGCALPPLDGVTQRDMRSDRNSETEYFGTARLSKFASTIPSIPSDGEDATNWVPNPGRKAGRPIMYTGDPNAPGLTSLERRTIARRYANRQSARRIRLRRQDHLVQLEDEVKFLQEANTALRVQNKLLRDTRDSRRSNLLVVPREALPPISSTQEDAGSCDVLLREPVSCKTVSGILCSSTLAQWDGCFELIPAGFLGPD
ncbi:g9082 [Coccomyxa viridis]|uniref:G9082 protein n=1 Tax=Coccomyxa viridis TaxID=1274662 RepID=A0ABP1G893_9CHLO